MYTAERLGGAVALGQLEEAGVPNWGFEDPRRAHRLGAPVRPARRRSGDTHRPRGNFPKVQYSAREFARQGLFGLTDHESILDLHRLGTELAA